MVALSERAGAARVPALPRRLPLLGLGILALLAGLTGALVLLGLPMPSASLRLGADHGLLMTLGFLGTVIALERAVALGRPWGYLAPLAAGLGGLSLVVGLAEPLGPALLTLGGACFVAMYVAFERIERSLHTTVQAAGAVAWLGAGLLLLAGRDTAQVVPWLAAFLVLTIVGERLELSRVGRLSPRARVLFTIAAVTFGVGVALSAMAPDLGVRIGGLGLLGLAAWLASNDIARLTVRGAGLTRFIALCLLVGYAWLAVAGLTWMLNGALDSGRAFDAMLHALFLGFVISMVFGHAPVILPSVVRRPLPYRPAFYAHLAVLHVGLLIRVVGGDILGSTWAWQAGGSLDVIALLLFLAVSGTAMATASRPRPTRSARV
ncbi:MAG TPA: hypothetical protein VFW92_07990 [Candidatus Limnocylindrales bacterium]|nr:hypothetical protein [Candidatus Limnocylindrales bacterium]